VRKIMNIGTTVKLLKESTFVCWAVILECEVKRLIASLCGCDIINTLISGCWTVSMP
jgi:hypothetical protein